MLRPLTISDILESMIQQEFLSASTRNLVPNSHDAPAQDLWRIGSVTATVKVRGSWDRPVGIGSRV